MTSIVNHSAISEAFVRWSKESEQRRKPSWRRDFTPDEIRAAEIEAAREEGRAEAYADALRLARQCWASLMGGTSAGELIAATGAQLCAAAIEAKAKEAGR